MSNKFLSQYSIFFNKANTDLKVAEYLLNSEDEEIDMEVIYFHLQQAAEKYIKSLLSFNKIHFEKIHDIQKLMSLCEDNTIELPEYTQKLVALNPFAVEGRYGLIVEDMHDASGYIVLIKKLRNFVEKKLEGK